VSKDFFAYGTLMFADIMATVCGGSYQSQPALLRDYRRLVIRNEVYPGIRPQKGDIVRGTVYFKLKSDAWKRLDLFEGEMYRRDTIDIEYADGRTAKAQTYVVRPEFASRLGRNEWSAGEFLRLGKSRFQAQYKGFEMLKAKKGDG